MANDVVETVQNVAGAEVVVGSNPDTGTVLINTVVDTSFEGRKRVVKALANSQGLRENMNVPIQVVDIIAIQSEVVSDKGELVSVPRVTLIDDKGNSFHAMSDVVYNDAKRILGILPPVSEWPEPLPVIATEGKAKTGHYLTLNIA